MKSASTSTRNPHRSAENIWSTDAATGAEHQLTHFSSGRCLWPTISYDGKTIVFERHFAIWKVDTRSGKASEVAITLRGAPSAESATHTPLTHWRDLAISPDGNKLAVVDQFRARRWLQPLPVRLHHGVRAFHEARARSTRASPARARSARTDDTRN